MKILLKRWLVYVLLPAGLVLLLIPLNTGRTEIAERDFIFLESLETLGEATPPPAPPTGSSEATLESLTRQLEGYRQVMADEESHANTLTNSQGWILLSETDLAPYSALRDYLNERSRPPSLVREVRLHFNRAETVPMEEWAAFKAAFFGEGAEIVFQYANRVFRGTSESDFVEVQTEVAYLKAGYKGTGILFLLLGLWALHGLYAPPTNGIQVGRRGAIVLWDAILVGIGLLFMWMLVDFILYRVFGTEWFGGDGMMAGMSALWLLAGAPLMAFITTATALQTLWITREGIVLKGLTGMRALPWPDVREIHLSGVSAPRGESALLPPRTVTRLLDIRGETDSLRIMEPPMAATKREILQALEAFAPTELKEGISALEKEWSSLW